MNTYKCYDAVDVAVALDYERITAETSFEARKAYAKRHGLSSCDYVVALRIPAAKQD